MQFGTVALSVLGVVALSIPAFILKKTKLLNNDSIKPLTALLLYATSPVLVFCNFQQCDFTPEIAVSMLWVALVGLICFALLSIITIVIIKPKTADYANRVSAFCSISSNIGYMGLPVLQALFPNNPLPIIYCSVMITLFNVYAWTVGSYIITGDANFVSAKNAFLNPMTIALFVSLPFFIFNWKISELSPTVFNSIKMLGNCTTPLSMSILGIRLADSSLKEVFGKARGYVVALLKLIVAPLIVFGVLALFPNLETIAKQVIFTVMAMPTATLSVVFCEKYYSDGLQATNHFVLVTLLSILTIPLMLLII